LDEYLHANQKRWDRLTRRHKDSDFYDLPGVLYDIFDIVFTSYGVLHGLPDLRRWGAVITHYLKPGGIFYIVEDHPMFRVFRPKPGAQFKAERSYFHAEQP
jgi:SAM-dependent methyltransferase